MNAGPTPVLAPPDRGEPRPRPWLALIAAAVLLAVGGGLWWFWPDGSPGTSREPGQASIGEAPAEADGAGSVGAASTDDVVLMATPSSAAEPQPVVEVRPGALVARTEIPQSGPLGYTVRVLISNHGDTSASWVSIALRLSGVNLTVTPAGSTVRYEFRDPLHCLVEASPMTLGPGESITVDATVTALLPDALGGVESVRLDEPPCPV